MRKRELEKLLYAAVAEALGVETAAKPAGRAPAETVPAEQRVAA